MTGTVVRVLVIEDPPRSPSILVRSLDAPPGLTVVGIVGRAAEAPAAVQRLGPDVIALDLRAPDMAGLDLVRQIMRECPRPIVVISGPVPDPEASGLAAVEAGALAVVRRPVDADDRARISELRTTVRLMSEVKVVGRRMPSSSASAGSPAPLRRGRPRAIRVVAIGASTGGPSALADLLQALPVDFEPPILIVQHIAAGFLDGFTDWLSQMAARPVVAARHGDMLAKGMIAVAPDGHHLGVRCDGRVLLDSAAPENGLRPAVSFLFRSVREAYGADAAAVLLSGMGKDGAQELLELRRAGALTFAQGEDSALIFGMPGEAMRLKAADYAMAPALIGRSLAAATACP